MPNFVSIMGVEQIYCLPEQDIPNTLIVGDISFQLVPLENDFRQVSQKDDIRAILVRDRIRSTAYLCYLMWNHPLNLLEIDVRILSGTSTEEDFMYAVVCSYKSKIWFDFCKKEWRGLIGLNRNLYIVSVPEYLQINRLKSFQQLTCPNCGKPFRINVIKIFEENK